jgi:hypothetical protein
MRQILDNKKLRISLEIGIPLLLLWPFSFWVQAIGSGVLALATEYFYRYRNNQKIRKSLNNINFGRINHQNKGE